MLGRTLRMKKKKELPTPPKPPGTRKYSSVTRIHFYKEALGSVYTKKLKRLIGQAG